MVSGEAEGNSKGQIFRQRDRNLHALAFIHANFAICADANKGPIMKEHEFTLILTADPNQDEADLMYGTFNDGTISTIAGMPQVRFHREADSLEEAIRSAIGDVRSTGFDVERVEIEPNAVVQAS